MMKMLQEYEKVKELGPKMNDEMLKIVDNKIE